MEIYSFVCLVTLSPTLKLFSSFLLPVVAAVVGAPADGIPGLGIFDAAGSVPIPDDEDVEAADVGLGMLLIFFQFLQKDNICC